MKKAKKKGKSYSQGWFERQSRRFMSVLLCSSMLSTSVANTAAFAAATSKRLISAEACDMMKDRNFHWKKKTSGRQSGMLLKKGRQ